VVRQRIHRATAEYHRTVLLLATTRVREQEGLMNNSTMVTADRTTHLKIVVVSIIASIVVVAIGMTAHSVDTSKKTLHMNVPDNAGLAMMASREASTEIR
jgi:hypothetical protein